MHEISICEALLDQVVARRALLRFDQVRRVRVEIGRLSCLEPEALRFAFEVIGRDTVLEGATLDIAQPTAQAVCRDCGATHTVESRLDHCPACGGVHLDLSGGDSLRFVDMEVV